MAEEAAADGSDPLDEVPHQHLAPEISEIREAPQDPNARERTCSWIDLCFSILPARLVGNLRKRFGGDGLCYFSDCSGSDAPFTGLKDLEGKLVATKTDQDPHPRLKYKRASEAPNKDGDAPKLALTLNGSQKY